MQKTYHITWYVRYENKPNQLESQIVSARNIKDATLLFLGLVIDTDCVVGPITISEQGE